MIEVRTTEILKKKKMSKIRALVCSILIPIIIFSNPMRADMGQIPIELPPLEEVVCESYIVYNRTKGEIIISKDADKQIYPASMTKIMTVALALEYLDTSDYVVVSQTAIDATTYDSTMMGLIVGEQVRVSELIYGALLPSGNDAANVLGEAVVLAVLARPEGYEFIVEPPQEDIEEDEAEEPSLLDLFNILMNDKAAQLGLTQTHFMNSNGLHDDMHYTTAAEIAIIFDYALSFEAFRIAINTPSHVYQSTNMHTFDGWRIARNTNLLLSDPWILGENTNVVQVVGGKTGTTSAAGTGMALLAINQNGDEMITVVCGIPISSANRQTTYVATVLNAGAQECFARDPVIRVEGNVIDYVPVNAPGQVHITGPGDVSEDPIEEEPERPAPEATPVEAISPALPEPEDEQTGLIAQILKHPIIVISIAALLLVMTALLFLFIIPAVVSGKRKKRRKSRYDDIRRI